MFTDVFHQMFPKKKKKQSQKLKNTIVPLMNIFSSF